MAQILKVSVVGVKDCFFFFSNRILLDLVLCFVCQLWQQLKLEKGEIKTETWNKDEASESITARIETLKPLFRDCGWYWVSVQEKLKFVETLWERETKRKKWRETVSVCLLQVEICGSYFCFSLDARRKAITQCEK